MKTNREKAIETMRERYLKEYKFINKKEDQIAFFEEIVEMAAAVGADAWKAYQVGLRWSTLGNRIAPSLTILWGDSEDTEFRSGLQYVVDDKLILRAGRVFGHYSAGYAAGVGGRVQDLGIDYSFEDYRRDLGVVHRIGLTWKLL